MVTATLRLLKQESDGKVLYTWDETVTNKGLVTHIGCFNTSMKTNRVVFVSDARINIDKCSINKESSVLAYTTVETAPSNSTNRTLPTHQDNSTNGTLPTHQEMHRAYLVELQPQRRTFSLSHERGRFMGIQFLYGIPSDKMTYMLVMLHKDSISLYSIPLAHIDDGIIISGQPTTERIVRSFSWCEWDGQNQRLYFMRTKRTYADTMPRSVMDFSNTASVFVCLQFHHEAKFDFMLELPLMLEGPCVSSQRSLLHPGVFSSGVADAFMNLTVLSRTNGTLCICYQHPITAWDIQRSKDVDNVAYVDQQYSITLPHHAKVLRGCAKIPAHLTSSARLLFFWLYDYLVVCLPGCFIHLLNVTVELEPVHHILLHNSECVQSRLNVETMLPNLSLLDSTIPVSSDSSIHNTPFLCDKPNRCLPQSNHKHIFCTDSPIVECETVEPSSPPRLEDVRSTTTVRRHVTDVSELMGRKINIGSQTKGRRINEMQEGDSTKENNQKEALQTVTDSSCVDYSEIEANAEPRCNSEVNSHGPKLKKDISEEMNDEIKESDQQVANKGQDSETMLHDETREQVSTGERMIQFGTNSPLIDIDLPSCKDEINRSNKMTGDNLIDMKSLQLLTVNADYISGALVVLTHGANTSGSCLYNNLSGSVYKAELNPEFLISYFRDNTEINSRLAILHFIVRNCREISHTMQIFEILYKDPSQLDIPCLMAEFLIATTYGRMRKQLHRDIYHLLPFTNTETFRGRVVKDSESNNRLSTIKYDQMNNINIGTKSYLDRRQWRNAEDMWDNLSQHLMRQQIEMNTRFSQMYVCKMYKSLQQKGEHKMDVARTSVQKPEDIAEHGVYPISERDSIASNAEPASTSGESSGCGLPSFLVESDDDLNGQEVLISIMENMLSRHIQQINYKKESKAKVVAVAKEYIRCQLQTSRHLLFILWSVSTHVANSNPDLPDLQNNDVQWSGREEDNYKLFQMLTKYTTAALDVAYPSPYMVLWIPHAQLAPPPSSIPAYASVCQGLQTYLTHLGYATLPYHVFLQHVDRGVLLLTNTFITRFILDEPDDQKSVERKLQLISRLSQNDREKVFTLWNHPIAKRYSITSEVHGLLLSQSKQGMTDVEKYSQTRNEQSDKLRSDFLPLNSLMRLIYSQGANQGVDMEGLKACALYNTQQEGVRDFNYMHF